MLPGLDSYSFTYKKWKVRKIKNKNLTFFYLGRALSKQLTFVLENLASFMRIGEHFFFSTRIFMLHVMIAWNWSFEECSFLSEFSENYSKQNEPTLRAAQFFWSFILNNFVTNNENLLEDKINFRFFWTKQFFWLILGTFIAISKVT